MVIRTKYQQHSNNSYQIKPKVAVKQDLSSRNMPLRANQSEVVDIFILPRTSRPSGDPVFVNINMLSSICLYCLLLSIKLIFLFYISCEDRHRNLLIAGLGLAFILSRYPSR